MGESLSLTQEIVDSNTAILLIFNLFLSMDSANSVKAFRENSIRLLFKFIMYSLQHGILLSSCSQFDSLKKLITKISISYKYMFKTYFTNSSFAMSVYKN